MLFAKRGDPSRGRTKTAPSPYPTLPFHLVRLAQLVSALVVSAIMSYFLWNLVHDHWGTPKTFWTLLAASLLTILTFAITSLLHCLTTLPPRLNLGINTILFCLWVPGFSFLWYYTRATLAHVCNKANWDGPTGIMVCRIYKALFAFSLLGAVSTLLALLLDIHIFRRTISRGKYHQMGAGAPAGARSGRGSHAPTPKLAPFYSDDEGRIVDVEERRRGGSDAEDDGDDVRHAAQHHVGGQKRGDGSGYEVPEEQFEYDTEYRGGGGDLGATGGRRP